MIYIENLKHVWKRFKSIRQKNPYFSKKDMGFITMLEREELIDYLFKHIEESKKCS